MAVVQAAHQSLKSRQCPLPRPSRTFHSCLLLWAPVGSGYQEPLHPPCAAYSYYHRPMRVSWPPSSPWLLLIVCAPGVPHQPGQSGRATGQPGEGPHSSGPKHGSSGVLQQTNQSGSAASGVPLGIACGCGLHSPDTPSSCTSVLAQPCWEPRRNAWATQLSLSRPFSVPKKSWDNSPSATGHWQRLLPVSWQGTPQDWHVPVLISEHRLPGSPAVVWREGCPGLSPEKQAENRPKCSVF